jgi:DNA excision repair protein ERCC-4
MKSCVKSNSIATIIIDTREIRPFEFPISIKRKLDKGDYSIEGFENQIAIERKSLDDWINTILRSQKRFDVELQALQNYKYAAVVIEATTGDLLGGQYKSDIKPESLFALTCHYITKYHPVHFIFAGERPQARALVGRLLNNLNELYTKIGD